MFSISENNKTNLFVVIKGILTSTHVVFILLAVIVKLFLVSALIVPVISLFSLIFAESFVLMFLCSAPAGVTTFTISMKQNWDIALVNEMILFTTIISLFALRFFMYVFQILVEFIKLKNKNEWLLNHSFFKI